MLTEAQRQACKIALMGWNFYALKIIVNSKPSAESQITKYGSTVPEIYQGTLTHFADWSYEHKGHPSHPSQGSYFSLVSLAATLMGNKYLLSKMSIFFSSAINSAHLTCRLQPQLNVQMSIICVSIATTKFLRKKHTGVQFTRNKGCSASMQSATKDGHLDSWPSRACTQTNFLR